MYRFLLRPRWILSHLFVLVCVVAMASAGFWQLSRLGERRDANAVIRAAGELATIPIAEVVPAGPVASDAEVDAVRWRSVQVTGTYLVDDQVLVANRSYQGAPGYWVITPLLQADGTAVAVNRGWVPYDVQPEGPWGQFAPPDGTVTVTGQIREPQVRSTGIVSGPQDAPEGVLRTLARVDVARLQQQVDTVLYPLYVDLRSQEPAQIAGVPAPVTEPSLDEGPHLSYALQWFTFALLTLVVYPLLLRRVARNRSRRDGADASGEGGDGPQPPPEEPVPGGAPLVRATDDGRPSDTTAGVPLGEGRPR